MRSRFHELVGRLRGRTVKLFGAREQANAESRSAVEHELSLGLEQQWKIETQLLLPALHPLNAEVVARAEQEVEILRDLALLARRCEAANRELVWAVTQRLAELHFGRVDALMLQQGAAGIEWAGMFSEAESWLAQWAKDLRAGGDIEDEDRDPVGEPPR